MFLCMLAVLGAGIDTQAISQHNLPAVVITYGTMGGSGGTVMGSGVCVHPSGMILTTGHTVNNVTALKVRWSDNTEQDATVVVVDTDRDVAVVQVPGPRPAAEIGNAHALTMGAPLMAISSPRGLEFTAVSGIVSNTHRLADKLPIIQTDLPFSDGSSGGPVFDSSGKLIGIVMALHRDFPGATMINPVYNYFDLLAGAGVAIPGATDLAPTEAEIIPAAGLSDGERRAVERYNAGVAAQSADEKITAYRESVGFLPNFFEAWFNLGVAISPRDAPQALAAYAKAQEIQPESIAILRNVGRVYLAQGDAESAEQAFAQASALRPDDPSLFNDLGEARRRKKEFDGAARAFENALRLRPDYPAAHYNLALALAERGQSASAVEHFETYLATSPDASDAAQVRDWIARLRNSP
ncbi:MAG: tetratricopeptide repeat protein [Candidatus Hydrogenedentota bacterium]